MAATTCRCSRSRNRLPAEKRDAAEGERKPENASPGAGVGVSVVTVPAAEIDLTNALVLDVGHVEQLILVIEC